jgi:ribosomal protein S18 acetylase RimI-like enzyme
LLRVCSSKPPACRQAPWTRSPSWSGIGTALLDAALRRCDERDYREVLLIVPRYLWEAGFGSPAPEDLAGRLNSPQPPTLIVELDGSAVGTLSLNREGGDPRIYGFVSDPAVQGRGLGRDALRRVCEQLRADGAGSIGLEVAVDNDRALGCTRPSASPP